MNLLKNTEFSEGEMKELSSNSTYRTMRILELLSYNEGITLEDLCPIVNLAKPTLNRFLQTLTIMKYVEKSVDDKYYLTPKLFAAASRSLAETELSKIAQPYMEDMSYRTGETTILAILDGNSAMYITKIESKYNLKFYEHIGDKVPLYCTAAGKVLLAGMDDKELERFFETEKLIPYTENTLVNKEAVMKEIAEIGRKGFSVSESEYENGQRAISVPIYNNLNKIIASLTITWPVFRDSSEKFQIGLEFLDHYAGMISMIMGYSNNS